MNTRKTTRDRTPKDPNDILRRAMVSTLSKRKRVFTLLAAYDRGEWEPTPVKS